MFGKKIKTPLLLTGAMLLGCIYMGVAFWYVSATKANDTKIMKNHATIISHDLWSLNTSGMHAYLALVASTNHYKYLAVITDHKETFLTIDGPDPSPLDTILLNIGFIRLQPFSNPVLYDGQKIGVLEGERYNRIVYPLFYIFLIIFFTLLTFTFLFYLIFNRRLLEYQVQERTQKYHDLVSLLPEMVLETDARGHITFANEKALKCFNAQKVNILGHDCREFIRLENGDAPPQTIFKEAKREELQRIEYRVRNSSGILFPVLVRTAPIYNNTDFIGARMVIIDITERQALEEKLARDQKMKSIGLMAGGVAHDLNNILSGIINYPELLLQQVPQNSPLIQLIEPIKDAGLRAAAVVADLLTVARGVAATRETINLNDIILDYTYSPEFKKLKSLYPKIRYTRSLSPKLNPVSCSVIHVRKSLMNLVNNASEAVEGGGHVTIDTENREVDSPITSGHGIIAPGSYTILTVRDSGKGIPPSELSQILEPFFSKKELGRSGTGLGLTVVWNTMQDHDGGIKIRSTPEGSSFQLFFPSTSDGHQVASPDTNVEVFSESGQSILIVDDEFQQRDIATKILESLGYAVTSVASGEAAISYLRDTKVDLVLLDMIMESGMNGLETYKEIFHSHPGQKALILSGFSESDDVKNTIRLGASGLVNKPYTREQLARKVYEVLNR